MVIAKHLSGRSLSRACRGATSRFNFKFLMLNVELFISENMTIVIGFKLSYAYFIGNNFYNNLILLLKRKSCL